MRWLCFLLLASPLLMSAAAAQTSGQPRPKSLQFDIAQVPATRDSFVFRLRGEERGWAVWQYEIRRLETTQEVVYSATSEFRPVEEERLRIVVDRLTGQPLSTFHHIDLFSPRSDTVMVEHDLEVKRGEISGRRRVGTRSGSVKITPVSRPFAPGTVLSDYVFLAGAVSNAMPGDSLAVPAYKEFDDSLVTLTFVAESPTAIDVPAGRFDVLPLRSGGFRIYATRTEPRRVVKGETLEGGFSFELVQSGPVVPTAQ
ncbi:MAG TPA: hypothetical protein VN945_09005 [Gemmatimonadales bacterium]|nr:hypothetical protein [Gemmatimonadales bacterium]